MGKNDQVSNRKLKFITLVIALVALFVIVLTGYFFGEGVAGIVATVLVGLVPLVNRFTSKWDQTSFPMTKISPVVFLILSFSGCQLLLNPMSINVVESEWFSKIVIDDASLELPPEGVAEIVEFFLFSIVSYFVVTYIGECTFFDLRYPGAIIAVSVNFIMLLISPLKLMIPINETVAKFLGNWENLCKPSVLLALFIVWVFFVLAAVGGMSLGRQTYRPNRNE